MDIVYYSLVPGSKAAVYQQQWIHSIESLRRFNRSIPVHLFVFNDPPPAILKKAAEHNVSLHHLGSYTDYLRGIVGDKSAALSLVPTLNKLLPLPELIGPVSRALFLDCDTFFFGDVAALFEKYIAADVYAREAPHSRRSFFLEYSPHHIDEDAFGRVATELGVARIPPLNTGVILLNHGIAARLAAVREKFLLYSWRLLLGAHFISGVKLPSAIVEVLREVPTTQRREALLYPSHNYWVIDEIAFSLALGHVQGVTCGDLRMEDAVQNGEFLIYQAYRRNCIVCHYFTSNEKTFFERVATDQRSAGPD